MTKSFQFFSKVEKTIVVGTDWMMFATAIVESIERLNFFKYVHCRYFIFFFFSYWWVFILLTIFSVQKATWWPRDLFAPQKNVHLSKHVLESIRNQKEVAALRPSPDCLHFVVDYSDGVNLALHEAKNLPTCAVDGEIVDDQVYTPLKCKLVGTIKWAGTRDRIIR